MFSFTHDMCFRTFIVQTLRHVDVSSPNASLRNVHHDAAPTWRRFGREAQFDHILFQVRSFGTAARPLSWRRFRPLQNLLVTSVPVLYQVAGATGAEREVQWVGDDHSRKLCKFFNRPSGCRCAPRKTVDRMRPKTAPVGAQKRRGLRVHPSTRAGWQGGGDGGAGGSCQRSCAALCEDCGGADCACDRADIGCE